MQDSSRTPPVLEHFPHLPYKFLILDLIDGFHYHFGSFHRGDYFPAVVADPAKYLYKRADVAVWLMRLRDAGKGVYLVCAGAADWRH